MIVSGLGYDPESGKWNRGRNVMIRQIECVRAWTVYHYDEFALTYSCTIHRTAQSFKTLLDAWNCGTNYWLRECMYKRLARKGKKPGFKSTMATFITSAFWHGFNPTYYISEHWYPSMQSFCGWDLNQKYSFPSRRFLPGTRPYPAQKRPTIRATFQLCDAVGRK